MAEKKEMFNKKPVKKWEKRWVLQSNVIEYGCDIWISKWMCVDNLNTANLNANVDIKQGGIQIYERVSGGFPS